MWLVWLEGALKHTLSAFKARNAGQNVALGEDYIHAQDDELHASMVAVSASAHAIDAFYGTVAGGIVLPDHLQEAWKDNGPKRPSRILETLKVGFNLGKKGQ